MADKEPEKERPPSMTDKRKSTTISGQPAGVKAEPKRSINTAYDKETDSNIFALGEAASHLDNLDDVLTKFGFNLKEMLATTKEGGETVTTSRSTFPSVRRERSGSATSIASDGTTGDVQVSTISKNYSDGRAVHTKIIQGPVQCKRRIVRVMRDTPNGPELLAEIEADPGCDVNKALESISSSALLGIGSGTIVQRRDSNGDYDNLRPNYCEREPLLLESGAQTLIQKSEVDQRRGPMLSNGGLAMRIQRSDPGKEALPPVAELQEDKDPQSTPKVSKRVSFNKSGDKSGDEELVSVTTDQEQEKQQLRKRFESVTEDDIKPYLVCNKMRIEEDVESDVDEDEDNQSLCWSCAKILKTKGKAMPKTFIDLSKGKLCMTASEINSEDDRSLPAAQSVLANYARMLVENRPQFVQTMFRAVKLNRVDVTKIFCKIIQKCGLRLGDHDFRETESSATILHVALLYNHVNIVDFLLEMGDRELILARYETDEYHNQTSLHVAVANGNVDLVERILLSLDPDDRVTLINTLADGYYFRSQHPHGQLCLTAAAWAGNGQVIRTLVTHGGDLAMKNLTGNTLLHSIIQQSAQYPGRNDYRTLFDHIWESTEIWAEKMNYDTKFAQQRELAKNQMQINLFKDLLAIRNNDGFTPLALATIKNSRLFQHMINLEKIYKIPQNKLGSIAWVTYDVTDITSFAKNTYNKFSVLHILAHNSQHLSRHANLDEMDEDYMEMEPVRTMLTRKWDVYRWIYILWLVVHLSYMILFTAVTIEINSCQNNCTSENHDGARPQPPKRSLVMFLILPFVYVVLELLDLFGSTPYRILFMTGQSYPKRIVKSIKSEWTITGNGPYRMVAVGFSFFTFYWFVLYFQRHPYQDVGLAMSLLLGWIFVLFFTRGCRVTCRFSIMIQKMFFRDLIYFLTVYGIVLVGFSFAMNAMFEDSSIGKIFNDMMSVVTDLDQKQNARGARHPMFAKLMLIFYAIIAVILLMNMLIAMMNTSYETIRVTRCNLWRQQQLSILLLIERRFFWFKWLCKKSERDVWRRDANSTGERCFIDVTMLHRPSYRCV